MEASNAFRRCVIQAGLRSSENPYRTTCATHQFKNLQQLRKRPHHMVVSSSCRPFSSSVSQRQDDPNARPTPTPSPENQNQSSTPSSPPSSQQQESPSSSLPYKPGGRPTDKPDSLQSLNAFIKQGLARSTTNQRSSPTDKTDVNRRLDSLFGPRLARLPSRPYANNNSASAAESPATTTTTTTTDETTPNVDLYSLMGESSSPSRPRRPPSSAQINQDLLFSDLERHLDAEIRKLDRQSSGIAIQLRLRPTLGRSVDVRSVGGDLTRAFRTMEIKCAGNKVRADERAQRTYVRAGQRRKELKSKRWRTLFKVGFLEACARVRRMKKQGW